MIILKSRKKTTETENYGSTYSVQNQICHILKYPLTLILVGLIMLGSVTITIEVGIDGATTSSRVNFSGYIGRDYIQLNIHY